MTNFDENKALVYVILSNGLINIRFALFPRTAMSSKKNAEFLTPPPLAQNNKFKPGTGAICWLTKVIFFHLNQIKENAKTLYRFILFFNIYLFAASKFISLQSFTSYVFILRPQTACKSCYMRMFKEVAP